MGVIRSDGVVRLVGLCRVEDAEPLAAMLQLEPGLHLDMSACEGLHAAVLQVLLALSPVIDIQPPAGSWTAALLASRAADGREATNHS